MPTGLKYQRGNSKNEPHLIPWSEKMMKWRTEELAKIETVFSKKYQDEMPSHMRLNEMDKINQAVFGADTYSIYLQRKVFNAKQILVSDFSENGFFYTQIVKELQSTEYENIYELINSYGSSPDHELADLNLKWCIARYEREWFRAYIEDILPDGKIKVFFVDYGTSAVVKHSDTCTPLCDEADIWEYQPLLLPCIVKDMNSIQYSKFKKLQYISLNIHSMKLIEDSAAFEVVLKDDDGVNLLDLLP